ncbi:ABC transporter permease [Conexibacter sp. CPCC 206217]|uniref:ABC transporter permease n=1 Tax=Conexibacter sp. CPCC 206217 TaxID=3064574 RepID=UPI00271984D2|nr:ABC transporter permease [Conexibacter sp. CPCC 206217]MDO8212288.1 ABC transporter permease [Conexibacter sp. CPCC 206217]
MSADVQTAKPVGAPPRPQWKTLVPKAVPFTALLLLVIVFAGTTGFLTSRNLDSIINALPVLMLVGAGATLPILLGSIDLSLAGVVVLAGGVSATLAAKHGEAWLLVAPLIGIAAGTLNGLVIAVGRLPSFLVTLGSYFAFTGLAQVIMGGVPQPFTGELATKIGSNQVALLGQNVSYLVLIGIVVLALVIVFTARTRYGRYMYAIGGAERVSRLSGLPVTRVKIAAFALSGLLASIAGLMLTMRASAATPTMGDPFLLTSIAAVVVGGTSLSGGIGGVQWTLLGALVITVLDNGMTLAGVDAQYQIIIRGLVIIVASALTIRRLSDVVK